MKKVLALLMICLSSMYVFATGEHYQYVTQGCGPMTTKFNCVLVIDGVEQASDQLEIAAFDQDGICRAAKLPKENPLSHRYVYQMQLRGAEGYTVYTFRVYDHVSGMDLPVEADFQVEYNGEILTQLYYMGNVTIGSAMNPKDAVFNTVGGGIDKEITCYTGAKDNYYLISSPVGAVDPEAVTNMIAPNDYDLYYFNQSGDDEGNEWFNYKAGAFGLEPGKGYLYANAGDGENPTVTLTFPGTAYEGTGTFDLEFDENAVMYGWNLKGNPFNANATVDREFCVIDPETGAIVPSVGNTVEPMQGIFVEAAGAGEQVTFTVGEGGKVSKLALNLLGNNSLVDRAIVNFGEGSLSKFQINSSSTKLYIPMDGEEYAVVSSAEMGELPVNFESEKSGSYTLAVSSELSFNYLHLIDNKTGADIDLLATPSYSFEAQTTDYASRFRLVFATGNSEDTFAFYSNGSFVINNEGEATVQVMDVTGRMLSSEAINGSASINVEGAAGVYMVRLVNGENVRVQKIIVK